MVGRRKRLTPDFRREEIWTLATQITLARAVISTATLLTAVGLQSRLLLVIGLAISMLLDILDGAVARAKKVETILGAQLDGVADRLAAALVLASAVYIAPSTQTAIAAAVVWIQYGVVEQLLNGQFMRFGLWSPDHFYVESESVWRLNWTARAKTASGVPVAAIALGLWLPALVTAAVLIAVRMPCYAKIAALAEELPEPHPLPAQSESPPQAASAPAAAPAVAAGVDRSKPLAA
ncbi:MAG: CDP-alcohol phosphatidyltransferase family protein [Solirubrobacterales bacterium]